MSFNISSFVTRRNKILRIPVIVAGPGQGASDKSEWKQGASTTSAWSFFLHNLGDSAVFLCRTWLSRMNDGVLFAVAQTL